MFGNLDELDLAIQKMAVDVMGDRILADETAPEYVKCAVKLGRAVEGILADMHRLMKPHNDRSDEEHVQIFKEELEYLALMHGNLKTFLNTMVEKYGEDVLDEPV
jgi:hypothetical protein